ncbi:MAG: transglutaminase-like domain-containing protein [Deltaproteobacteria bacterium]|nr:transglutaminase-like domain-containing protein [Deltaproteobacteria bacterium]
MKPNSLLVFLIAAWCSGLSFQNAFAGTVIAGWDQTDLLIPAGVEVADYENSGYRLEVRNSRVRVRVHAEPLESRHGFELPTLGAAQEERFSAEPKRLARAVVAGASTRYEAVTRLLDWVGRNIRYDLDRQAPQDALSVLDRRTAYCTGLARLSVALLGSIGIESREVVGFVVPEGRDAVFHRWIEVHYPDRGWVFSDPQFSLNYVPATYVRLASPYVRGGEDLSELLVLVDRTNSLMPVDESPYGDRNTTTRRNKASQTSAALLVLVEDGGEGRVVLERPGFRQALSLDKGEGIFLGVRPGRYSFRLLRSGLSAIEGSVHIRAAERRYIQIPLSRLTASSPS